MSGLKDRIEMRLVFRLVAGSGLEGAVSESGGLARKRVLWCALTSMYAENDSCERCGDSRR